MGVVFPRPLVKSLTTSLFSVFFFFRGRIDTLTHIMMTDTGALVTVIITRLTENQIIIINANHQTGRVQRQPFATIETFHIITPPLKTCFQSDESICPGASITSVRRSRSAVVTTTIFLLTGLSPVSSLVVAVPRPHSILTAGLPGLHNSGFFVDTLDTNRPGSPPASYYSVTPSPGIYTARSTRFDRQDTASFPTAGRLHHFPASGSHEPVDFQQAVFFQVRQDFVCMFHRAGRS